MLLAYSDKEISKTVSGNSTVIYKKGEVVGFSFEDSSPYIMLKGYNTTENQESDKVAPCIYIDDKLWEALSSSSIDYKIKDNIVDTGLTDYKYPVTENKTIKRLSVKDNYVPISEGKPASGKTNNPNDGIFEEVATVERPVTLTLVEQLLARAVLQEIGNDACKQGAIAKTPDVLDLLKVMKKQELLDDTCIAAAQTSNFISQDEANALKATN